MIAICYVIHPGTEPVGGILKWTNKAEFAPRVEEYFSKARKAYLGAGLQEFAEELRYAELPDSMMPEVQKAIDNTGHINKVHEMICQAVNDPNKNANCPTKISLH